MLILFLTGSWTRLTSWTLCSCSHILAPKAQQLPGLYCWSLCACIYEISEKNMCVYLCHGAKISGCHEIGSISKKLRSCYDLNISLTYHGRLVRLWMSNSVQWMWRFALSDTSRPTWPSVLMFSFLLRLKYFSDILWTSGRTPDVGLCTMATAFFHYRTTRTQFGRVFRCFPFITFHLSFFQIDFHSYLAYLISDIS